MSNNNAAAFKQMDKFAKDVNIMFSTALRVRAIKLFTSIVTRTPIDKGLARASWRMGVNTIRYPDPEEAAAGRFPPAEDLTILDNVKPGDKVIIGNALPYIHALENGHSEQAPAGMVGLAINEVTAND